MTEKTDAPATLRRFLELTRSEEMDCDSFVELMAPWLDDRIDDAAARALLEHHRDLCAECAEQLAILKRALGGDGER